MWMILFLALPVLGMGYVGWHLWTLLPLNPWWKVAFIATGAACCLLLFLNFTIGLDRWSLPVARIFYDIGTSSLFILLYAVMLFLVIDIARLFHLMPGQWVSANWYGTLAVFVLLFGIFLYGNLNYKHKVRVPLELKTRKPLNKQEYKLVMLTDLHLGYHNPRKELARWVGMINEEKPDLILIAGDIIDISVRPLIEENMAAEFRKLNAPVYACLGNHEYYSGNPQAQQFCQEAGIRLLNDSSAEIDNSIVIIGRDDRTNMRRKPLKDLVANIDKGRYLIVLDHQPYNLDRAEQAGIDFQLSGHTHRGQVWPISWITDAMYECAWGQHQRGNTRFYVSSGIGIWGGKFRIGTQSEYIVATLRTTR